MSDYSDFENQWADTPESFVADSIGLGLTPADNRDERDQDWEPPQASKSSQKKIRKEKDRNKEKEAKKSHKSGKKGKQSKSKTTATSKENNSNSTSPNNSNKPSTSKEDSPGKNSDKGRNTPETSCAICLGPIDNKSFTDQCFHEFCYTCLDEWAKVKAVCPLCKTAFNTIIYNVRSITDFDQKNVPSTELRRPDRRFRYRTTVTEARDYFQRNRTSFGSIERHSAVPPSSRGPFRRPYGTSSAFRKRVYAQSLRIKELRTSGGREPRFRNISPDFFRANQACTHRLVPWLNRELNVLLLNHMDHIMFVMDLVLNLIKRYHIQSAEFTEQLRPFLGSRTAHFQHEFFWFARSPYDMATFDRHAVYESSNPHLVESSTSSSDSDYNDLMLRGLFGLSPPQRLHVNISSTVTRHDATARYVSNLLSHPVPASSGWESPVPGPSGLSNLTTASGEVINIESSDDDRDTIPAADNEVTIQSAQDAEPNNNQQSIQEPSNHVGTNNTNETITIDSPSSSDGSDIMCVAVEKPWNDRSPILLVSSEEEGEIPSSYNSARHNRHGSGQKRKHDDYVQLRRESRQSKKQRSHTPPKQYRYQRRSESRSPLNSRDHHRHKDKHRHRRSRSRSADIHVYVRSRHRSRSEDRISFSGSEHSYRHRKHKHKKHKKHKKKHRKERVDNDTQRKDRSEKLHKENDKHTKRLQKLTEKLNDEISSFRHQLATEITTVTETNVGLCKTSNGYRVVENEEYVDYYGLKAAENEKKDNQYEQDIQNTNSNSREEASTSNSVSNREEPVACKKHPTGHKKSKRTLESVVQKIKNDQISK